jgi:lycopene cyclase domain-containing protein
MAVARHGTGPGAALRAFVTQIHPVFMLPPLAASLFGMVLAADRSVPIALAHVAAMFFAVYTAHTKDGYVDFYLRGEDDDHPMTVRGCRAGLLGATVGFAVCLVALFAFVDGGAVLVTVPAWVIGYLHAPQFDTNPVTTTLGYPAGIALALFGGYYVQSGRVGAPALAFAGVFLVVLAGVKVIDDTTDYEYDRSIGKRTVAVALGPRRARRLADRLLAVGSVAVLAFTIDGLFPVSAPLAALAFGIVVAFARRSGPDLATKLLVRGAYVLLAILVVAVWLRPLASVSLPDIGVLGPYTYLATEAVFGALALWLLFRADAVGRAARTIAVLYPLAYVWDWYTLTIGVFEIPLRTGVELLGIPLEEHLFMLVVPALVLGVHETLRDSGETPASADSETRPTAGSD